MLENLILNVTMFWPVFLCTFLWYIVSFVRFVKIPTAEHSERAADAREQLELSGQLFYIPFFFGLLTSFVSLAGFALISLRLIIKGLRDGKTYILFVAAADIAAVAEIVYIFYKLTIFFAQ